MHFFSFPLGGRMKDISSHLPLASTFGQSGKIPKKEHKALLSIS